MKTKPEARMYKQEGPQAVQNLSAIISATNILSVLLQNINKPLTVEAQLDKVLTWGKSLSTLYLYLQGHKLTCT